MKSFEEFKQRTLKRLNDKFQEYNIKNPNARLNSTQVKSTIDVFSVILSDLIHENYELKKRLSELEQSFHDHLNNEPM